VRYQPVYELAFFIVFILGGCSGGNEQSTVTSSSPETGVLRVLESNPRWLTDDSGKARYFTGPSVQGFERPNACWSAFQDIWNTGILPEPNDYAAAFDRVVSNGHNFIRMC
jgi:hypothetical protein